MSCFHHYGHEFVLSLLYCLEIRRKKSSKMTDESKGMLIKETN